MRRLWYLSITAAAVAVDVITKHLAQTFLSGEIELIPGVFSLSYIENGGVAFGAFQNARIPLVFLTLLIIGLIAFLVAKYKPTNPWVLTGAALLLGGAVGNLIDRVYTGVVVDFLYFKLINFPVFNAADTFVVTGAIMLGIYFVFIDKSGKTAESGEE